MKLLSSHLYVCLVSSLSLCGNSRRAMPLRVSVLCHVRKLGPRGGIGQSPLRENKTVVLRVIIYDRTCLEHLTPPVVVRLAVSYSL